MQKESGKSDTCKTCDTLKTKIEAEEDKTAKAQLVGECELNHAKVEQAYQQLKEDTALAKSDPTVFFISFDLQ